MYVPAGRPQEGQRETGHMFPVDRDPQVRELARAAVSHADAYVNDVLDPQMYELRQFCASKFNGMPRHDARIEQGIEAVKRLHDLVRTLPGTMAEQISAAGKINDVRIEAPLEHQIALMQSSYPWMAPKLVRLRHALSEQALMDNVARPAAQQIGFG